MADSYKSKEIFWIRKYYPGGENLKPKELNHVLAFGIIWNIFESIIRELSGRNQFYSGFECVVQKNFDRFVRTDYFDQYCYFSARYKDLNNEEIKKALKFRIQSHHEEEAYKLVCKILKEGQYENIPIEDIIKCIGYIIYRLRNNLFHGLKPYSILPEQNENFENANIFLINVIDTLKR